MTLAAVVVLEIPTEALAGQIYGQITTGGKSVSEDVQVVITCSGVPPASTRTDRFGSYQLYVAANGRCQIAVHFGGAAIVGDIVSYANPVRYNFDILGQGTRAQLIRR